MGAGWGVGCRRVCPAPDWPCLKVVLRGGEGLCCIPQLCASTVSPALGSQEETEGADPTLTIWGTLAERHCPSRWGQCLGQRGSWGDWASISQGLSWLGG